MKAEREQEVQAASRYQWGQKRYQDAEKRSYRERWRFPVKVRVRHPLIGEIIVPGASKYAAILCACEKCHLDFLQIHDAEVWTL